MVHKDDIRTQQPCDACGGDGAIWLPIPGVWICKDCFLTTDSIELKKLSEKEEKNNGSN